MLWSCRAICGTETTLAAPRRPGIAVGYPYQDRQLRRQPRPMRVVPLLAAALDLWDYEDRLALADDRVERCRRAVHAEIAEARDSPVPARRCQATAEL